LSEKAIDSSVAFGGHLHALFAKLADRELTTHTAASLTVPDLADVCVLDMLEPDGTIRRRDCVTHLADKRATLHELGRFRPDLSAPHPSAIALRAKHSVFVPKVDDERLATWTRDPGHLAALRALGPRSTLAVPLAVRDGEVIGTLTLHRLQARSPFASHDLAIVEEVARFAALALDNARLIEALDRARAEAARARDRLREMLMNAPFSIAVRRGPEHVFELVNARFEELVGRDGMVGRPFAEVFPAADSEREILDRVYASGEIDSGRERHLELGPGRDLYVDYAVQPTHDEKGDVDGLVSFAVDVTEQVQARTSAETLARRVEEQQKWLEAVLDVLPVPILLVQQGSARVLFANAAADRIAGGRFPREEVHDADPAHFGGYDGSGNRLSPQRMPVTRAARGERLDGLQIDWDTPTGRKSLLFHSEVLPAVYGHEPVAVLAFDDVSKLKQTEAQLQSAVRVRDDFLAIASHELRTPLTALRLQVQGLLRAGGHAVPLAPDRLQARHQAIDRNVDRLTALIEKLLNLPRIASGRLDLDREPFDLAELVDEVTSRFTDELARAGSSLALTVARPVHGSWDRLRLDQALTNLLANAVKYGRGRPIELKLEETPERATLSVRDHGIGVALADQARIFERFERAVSDRNYGGFGLGLFITKHVVEAHGGAVRVESALGEGATFFVELPKS
jgi:PAS domain S-box-containing protein